jgi:hypothetical protein
MARLMAVYTIKVSVVIPADTARDLRIMAAEPGVSIAQQLPTQTRPEWMGSIAPAARQRVFPRLPGTIGFDCIFRFDWTSLPSDGETLSTT